MHLEFMLLGRLTHSAAAVERSLRLNPVPADLQPCMRYSFGMRCAFLRSHAPMTSGDKAVCAPGRAEGHKGHSRELQLLKQLYSFCEELIQRLSSRIAVRPECVDLRAAITSLLCKQAMNLLASATGF